MLTEIEYRILRRLGTRGPAGCSGKAYENKSKLRVLLGDKLLDEIKGKTVVDFGCGDGQEAVEMARHGAKRVIGIDIQQGSLQRATELAASAGVSNICHFSTQTDVKADLIVSIDGFEHFGDPLSVLRAMCDLLVADGAVLTSFGPTWYHPYGGHLFSVFPWAHLVFSEKSLIRWRSDFKTDGATRFGEVAGGLNQMTIGRFEKTVASSPFRIDWMRTVPIRRLAFLHNPVTREFTTAVVQCRLSKRG